MLADQIPSPYLPRATRMAAKLAAVGHSFTPESLCDVIRQTFDLEDHAVAHALRQPPERIEPWVVAIAPNDEGLPAGFSHWQIAKSLPDAVAYLLAELARIRQYVTGLEVRDGRVAIVGQHGVLAEVLRPLSVTVENNSIQEASRVLEGVALFHGEVLLAERLKQFLPWLEDAEMPDMAEPGQVGEPTSPRDIVARIDHQARRMQLAFALRGTQIRKTLAYELLALTFDFPDWNHLSAAHKQDPQAGRTPYLVIDHHRDVFWHAPNVEIALAFARSLPPVTAAAGRLCGYVSAGITFSPLCELRRGKVDALLDAPLIYSVLALPLLRGRDDIVQLLTRRGDSLTCVLTAAREILAIGGQDEDQVQAYALLHGELYAVERKGYRFSLWDTGHELHLRVIALGDRRCTGKRSEASVRLDAVHFKPAQRSDDGAPWLCKYDGGQERMALPGLNDADLEYLYWEFAVAERSQPRLEQALGPAPCADIIEAWVADGGTVDEYALQRP